MKNKIIVYERLNIFTFCFSLIARHYYRNQYFIEFSPLLKKYLNSYVKRILKQIHLINYLDQAVQQRTSEIGIEIGNKIVEDCPGLARSLCQYVNDQRAKSLVKQVFVFRLINKAYKYTILKEFAINNKSCLVCYFPTENNLIIDYIKDVSDNLFIVKWHLGLLRIVKLLENIVVFCGLLLAPFYLCLRLVRHNRITLRGKNNKLYKKIIFFHTSNDLPKGNNYRDMYFFHNAIFKISECLHVPLQGPFAVEKADYLQKGGGAICDYQHQRVRVNHIFKRLFVDYLIHFGSFFHVLSFNRHFSFSVMKSMIGIIDRTIKVENLLENMNVKMAFFESEMGLLLGTFTIMANKYGIKTMTFMHGYGGYCSPDYTRAYTVVNSYLVPGNYYFKHLKRNNPDVDKFWPVGDHEIEEVFDRKSPNLMHINKDNKKIIGVFATYYWPFFLEHQKVWCPLFDENDGKKGFLKYWLPFFKWAGQQRNLFFVFKDKYKKYNGGYGNYDHPFLKEALSGFPKDRYYINSSMLIKDVIALSSCTICTGNSSTFYSSLCYGVPSISYGIYGDVAAEKYNKYLVARNPDELIKNIKYILKNGLPESLFNEVRKDHYAEGRVDGKTAFRIKKLITEILQDSHTHSING